MSREDWERASDWEKDAKCLGEDPELFFPGRAKSVYRITATQAKAICLGKDGRPACGVREECLTHALDQDERYGIWGGLSHRERNARVRKAARSPLTEDDMLEDEDCG